MSREPPPVADPRPRIDGGQVIGVRCSACGATSAQAVPRCPVCFGPVASARFGPHGTVWSSTVIHLPVLGHQPPFALAYVDLDGGPRVLVHLGEPIVVPPDTRVALVGERGGDLYGEALR